jgi:hypothetical protein
MLEFIVDKAITAIRKNDYRVATIYTFPFPRLRQLILFMLWDESFDDFDKKQNLLRFATENSANYTILGKDMQLTNDFHV